MWHSIVLLFIRLIGAFLNRVRGGLRLPDTDTKYPINKMIQPVCYGLFLWLITGVWWMFPIGLVQMYAGQQIAGWGAYIGSVTTGCPAAPECKPIDWICRKLERWPILWGWAALSLRGLMWTCLLGCYPFNVWVCLSGLAMGSVYLGADWFCKLVSKDTDKNSWNLAEWAWGAWIWTVVYVCKGVL